MSAAARAVEALGLVVPFGLWAMAFAVLYGAHGFACGIGVQPDDYASATRLALALMLVVFLAAHAALAWWFWRRWRAGAEPAVQFVRFASLVLAIAAAATTLWTGFPVLVLEICS